jgi:hypothetical protein
MLIPDLFQKWNINARGIIHVGAHYCEERSIYAKGGCDDSKVIWVEGNPEIYSMIKAASLPLRAYNALIADAEDKEVDFIITNNEGMSSSFLELKEHLIEHPMCRESHRIKLKTTTLPTFLTENNLNPADFDFLIMDIQGAELHALKGMESIMNNFNHIYLEVNTKELYAGCGLLHEVVDLLDKHGFVMRDIIMTPHGWGDAYFSRRAN